MADPRHDLLELMPSDTPDYMAPAWIGCIRWAISEPEIVAEFQRQTGRRWVPARSGFERMIDDATGAEWGYVSAFVVWVNAEIWGPMDGSPAAPQE